MKRPPAAAVILMAAAAALLWHMAYPSFIPSRSSVVAGTADAVANAPAIIASPPPAVSAVGTAAAGTGVSGAAGQPVAVLPPGVAAANPPGVDDEESLVADLGTGQEYVSVNAGERWPLASVSKLMTAVVASQVLNPSDRITITQSMIDADPTERILHVGDVYTVANLMYIMLLPSNNVAAEAFAQYYGRARFLAAMNAQAQAWGMTNTYYDDPSGLSAGNESTADDLLKLARHVYGEYPQILAVTRTPSITLTNLATGQPVMVRSINAFAGTPGFIGGKTGYTDQADGNLLSIFSYHGRAILVLVMGVSDAVRFSAAQTLFDWFKQNNL